jgi:hypothetical protein
LVPSFVNPQFIKRLDCSVVHGKLGAGSCETNAIKRWIAAFLDCFKIYLPARRLRRFPSELELISLYLDQVHLVPQVLFNFRGLAGHPAAAIVRILFAASRSSAFLATFVASIYAS